MLLRRLKMKLQSLDTEVNEYLRFKNQATCVYGPNRESEYNKFVNNNKKIFIEIGKYGSLDELIKSLNY